MLLYNDLLYMDYVYHDIMDKSRKCEEFIDNYKR
jgi:hypothetical protein